MIAASFAGWISAGIACYAPTQAYVELTTDADCQQHAPKTAIYVGPSFDNAESIGPTTTACTPQVGSTRTIGSLYFVPRESRASRVTVHVVMGLEGADPDRDCRNGDPQRKCVVARRIFRFAEHRTRPIPIRLDRACAGLPCTDQTTCVVSAGLPPRCVGAVVPDGATTCMDCPAGDEDAGATCVDCTGSDAGDATAVTDAGPPCPGADPSGVVATFEEPGGFSDHMLVTENTLLWIVDTMTGPKLYAKDLGSAAPGSLRHTLQGSATAIAADQTDVWVGTDVGLAKITLPSFAAKQIGTFSSVISLAAHKDGVYVSGYGFGGAQPAVYDVDSTGLAVTEKFKAPEMLLAPGADATTQLFGLNPNNGALRRITIAPGQGSTYPVAFDDIPGAKDLAAAPTTMGLVGYMTDSTPPAKIVSFGFGGATSHSAHCTVEGQGPLAADSTGVYAVRTTTAGSVVTRCPPADPLNPTSAPGSARALETTPYGEIHGLALGPPTGCVYFSAKSPNGKDFLIRAARRGSTIP